MNVGLKLYSTNTDLITDARRMLDEGVCDYIELYIIPGSYDQTIAAWKNSGLAIPLIHAPHSYHGVNFARADMQETNAIHFNVSRDFADHLGSDTIIVHGGNNGQFEETLRQLRLLRDDRILLENKPQQGNHGERCVGWSPKEFRAGAVDGLISSMVLDFGHACCAAYSSGDDAMAFIASFLEFHPRIFHLSDGHRASGKDMHLNLGTGDFDLPAFVSVIPDGSYITLETPRNPASRLDDFVSDVHYLRKISAARLKTP